MTIASATYRSIGDAVFGGGRVPVDMPAESDQTGWTPQIALIAGVGLVGVALADWASRNGHEWAYVLFALCVMTFLLPLCVRALLPATSRAEQISLVVIAALALLMLRWIHEPTAFVDHDAFLHWATSLDILDSGRLFRPNPLLPISPLYPGLEIVTTAICELTGLSVFEAYRIVSLVTRLLFVVGLFLVYERITGSSRIASIGTLVYMGCSSFVYFDSMFSYGSLALTLLIAALLADVSDEATAGGWRSVLVLKAPLLAALALTHHLTGFIAALIFAALALLEWIRSGRSTFTWQSLATATLAIGIVTAWSLFVGNPSDGYLRPVFEDAWTEVVALLTSATGRTPFVAEDGEVLPAWQRYVTLMSVALVCLGLATGFFRSLAMSGAALAKLRRHGLSLLQWANTHLALLTLIALLFPVSIVLRLTRAGWEVGNRISPFAYLGVGLVVAIAVAVYWLGDNRSWKRTLALAAAGALCIFAGIVSGGGTAALGAPHYRVSADAASVEPLGISAAQWTQSWLGPDHRFFADRTNRLLLATYGRQQVITTLYDKIDLEPVVFSRTLGAAELLTSRETDLDFLALDLRLTQGLPVVGWYFDPGRVYDRPPPPEVFQKFTTLDGADRIFDNGYMSIVDVRKWRDGR